MTDGPRETAWVERRSGSDRRSNFRRAIDALYPNREEPISPECNRQAHAMCPQFCLWCSEECACFCHRIS